MVFGLLNNTSPPLHFNERGNNNNSVTETIQETDNWIRSHGLQIEFERCAQERRNRMERIMLNDPIDLPQIFPNAPTPESQDDELPTYEQAVVINA